MAFQLDTPPGITDIPDSLLEAGALASGFSFSALKENAAFGSVAPEVFFGTYSNGQTVALPVSTVDGYQYEQSELLYCWEIYNTLPKGGALPTSQGALRECEWYVDQSTGIVYCTETYCVGNGKGGNTTNDGVLGVWTVGIRGRTLRTLAAQPTYTDLPNSAFTQDNAAQPTPLQQLSHNAKLSSIQCEVFIVNPSNAPTWQANANYQAGNMVQPTQARCNGFWYVAANSGESGAKEPAWPGTYRNPQAIIDGGVIWNVAGVGFLNGQQVDFPTSGVDGYQYSANDVIVPHLSFISTGSAPVQFFSGYIDTSAAYPFGWCAKQLTAIQPALPTATTNRNFAPLQSRLNGSTTVYTALPPNLQLGQSSYLAPPAMALASPLLSPGASTTGVGVVNCGVLYSSGFFNDGTVMVTLFCFRAIQAMAKNPDNTPAGGNFTDFSTIAMTTGNPLTSPYMEDINENAKFSILRPEVFSCTYVPSGGGQTGYEITSPQCIPGGQIPIPQSPTDGYQYSREELTYLWWFVASSGPNGFQELDFALYVDPQSGVVNSTVQYIGSESTTANQTESNVGTIVYGAGGLLTSTNVAIANAAANGQPRLRVIIFAQRQHETELQATVVYSTTGVAAQPSVTNLLPNGGFEIWSTPNPNYAELTGVADDWFVNWQQGATIITDMGVTNGCLQFPGQNALPGAGPNAPYVALIGNFSQGLAVVPSCKNNNGPSGSDYSSSRQYTPLENGSATLSIVSEIIPVWPGGEYRLQWFAAAYATTDFNGGSGTGDPFAGVSPDYIGAGFYARVHVLGQNQNGNGQPDLGTDTVFELLCDRPNGGSLGSPAGLQAGTNNGYGVFGAAGALISPPMCERFNFTFTIPASAGVSGVPVTGELYPGNSLTPAVNVPSASFNFGPSAASPNNSAFFSTGLPASGPVTIDFIPAFVYVEFLLWDIWGTGYDHLRVALIDQCQLFDLSTGQSALLQLSNLGQSYAMEGQGSIAGYGGLNFTYSGTSSSLTATWTGFNVYFPSGTSFTVAGGSHTFSGLAPSTTYDLAASVNTLTGEIQNWAIYGPTTLGAASTVPVPYVVQTLNKDNNVPLLSGGPGMQAATAATGGSSSGGGGTPRPAPCPEIEMMVAPQMHVGGLMVGDPIDCIDGRGEVQKTGRFQHEHCVRITTEDGHALVVSDSTPFTLWNGGAMIAREMDGQLVATDKGPGTPIVWMACRVQRVGRKFVNYVSVGGRTFAAGENPNLRIYSHNISK